MLREGTRSSAGRGWPPSVLRLNVRPDVRTGRRGPSGACPNGRIPRRGSRWYTTGGRVGRSSLAAPGEPVCADLPRSGRSRGRAAAVDCGLQRRLEPRRRGCRQRARDGRARCSTPAQSSTSWLWRPAATLGSGGPWMAGGRGPWDGLRLARGPAVSSSENPRRSRSAGESSRTPRDRGFVGRWIVKSHAAALAGRSPPSRTGCDSGMPNGRGGGALGPPSLETLATRGGWQCRFSTGPCVG